MPESKALIPSRNKIINAVCNYYNIDEDELYKTKRGITNEPRNVSIYLTRRLRKDSLNEIGKQYKIEKYSSVSSILERVKKLMKEDSTLAKHIDEVSSNITKSQKQT